MFHISDKVVCVDDSAFKYPEAYHPCGNVERGVVYCVSHMRTTQSVIIVGKPAYMYGIDIGWRPSRFRKLSEVQAENELARTLTNFPAHSNNQTSAR